MAAGRADAEAALARARSTAVCAAPPADRMLANLQRTGGALVTERLTVALAPTLGRAPAKKLLSAATADALVERALHRHGDADTAVPTRDGGAR
ncbi:hypothetical protein [Streptomyces sp. NPDC051677]|uniref:hypothetical protein n=1 Tax=Streptomyces sp. NPDC051677 TaxID=3365669 RepID=UPI0037D05EB8